MRETLVWLRVPGDIVFAAAAVLLAGYAIMLLRRPQPQPAIRPPLAAEPQRWRDPPGARRPAR